MRQVAVGGALGWDVEPTQDALMVSGACSHRKSLVVVAHGDSLAGAGGNYPGGAWRRSPCDPSRR